MESPIFVYKPSFPPIVFYIVWILPVLCIPAGIMIYLTEGRNLAQLLSISLGVGVIGPALLFLLLKSVGKYIENKGEAVITADGVLTLRLKNNEQKFPLNSLTDIGLSGMPGATSFHIIKKSGETIDFILPGNMNLEQERQFKEIIGKFDFN